jgi:hypothetical protein
VTPEDRSKMPYITSVERHGIERGRIEGLREAVLHALERRFGPVEPDVRDALDGVENVERLKVLHGAAMEADTLESFRGALAT